MNLLQAKEGREYTITRLGINDAELEQFLFSLGCYPSQPITVVSHMHSGAIVSIKDGRYTVDKALAAAISVTE